MATIRDMGQNRVRMIWPKPGQNGPERFVRNQIVLTRFCGPPVAELAPLPSVEPVHDLAWLHQLEMPDIPVRWDARVVRYLEFYKDNPRGRSMVAGWIKKSGRYGGSIRRVLREEGVPEDVLWLALVESGFDPTIGSPAGAAGLWQFMRSTGRRYMRIDSAVDDRLDPVHHQHVVQVVHIPEVADDESVRWHGLPVAVGQVVEDGDLVAAGDEQADRVAADVAGSAGNQNSHDSFGWG